MFADRDTSLYSRVTAFDNWPSLTIESIVSLAPSLVLPCGGMENQTHLWSQIENRHEILGPKVSQLSKLRDPFWLSERLKELAGALFVPELRTQFSPECFDGSWLIKNRSSTGGLHTRLLSPDNTTLHDGDYLQRRIEGQERSVVIECGSDISSRILFVSKPIDRSKAVLEAPLTFKYQGNIGPASLDAEHARAIQDSLSVLVSQLGFIGLLQIDLMIADGRVAILEINPRWTASMEIAEQLLPGILLSKFRTQSQRQHVDVSENLRSLNGEQDPKNCCDNQADLLCHKVDFNFNISVGYYDEAAQPDERKRHLK